MAGQREGRGKTRTKRKNAQALIDCSFAAYELRAALEAYDNRDARDSGFDGMPKPHWGTQKGLETKIIQEQSAQDKLHAKHAAYLRCQRRALRALDRIISSQPQQDEGTMKLRAFLKAYYIDGDALKAAWTAAGISERTARRYKAEVGQAAKRQKEG